MISKINKLSSEEHLMSNETDKEIPDMSEVDLDTRLKVLLGVAPEGEEIVVYEEPEEEEED